MNNNGNCVLTSLAKMISSRLILIFCFGLFLTDNSHGQKTILQQGGNKKLFKDAIDFGATYGGEVGELGSQWKQLLFELVQAKRKVGLAKYQLARFNDSATEEVDLDIRASYADKVAELVAIRTQDIGTTQKYVDDLEILKDEIALTMIVEMEELEEKLKQTNVRKKVKEAKENGITDTDIKEILFAEYVNSGVGLPLIGEGASTGDALLSSFLNGMEIILDEAYHGIIEYGKGVPVGNNHPLAGGDSDPDEYDVPGSSGGSPGGAAGGSPGGASGGGGSGGPPTGPPTAPPTGEDVPDDSHEQDEKKDEKKVKDPHKDLATFFQEGYPGIDLEEDIKGKLATELSDRLPENGRYNDAERAEAENIVQVHLEPIRRELATIERNLSDLEEEFTNQYQRDPALRFPINDPLTRQERIRMSFRRVRHIQLTRNRLVQLMARHVAMAIPFQVQYDLTRDNFNYYQALVGQTSAPETTLPLVPSRLADFDDLSIDSNRMRYLVSTLRWNDVILINERVDSSVRTINNFTLELDRLKSLEEEKIVRERSRLETPHDHRIG